MILDLIASAGFSTLLGGIFGYLGKKEERKNLQMKLDHDLSMIKARTDASIEIAKMGIEEAKNAGQLLVDKIEAKAFETSQKTTGAISEAVKSIIRPVILGVLLYQTYEILNSLETLTGGISAFEPEDILGLYKIVILSITSLTSAAVGWYFAQRTSKGFDKLLDKFGR